MEDEFKKAKNLMGTTGAGFENEHAIAEGSNAIQNKWDEVNQFCPWFYRMRNMVIDRFDDIKAAITNSETDIMLNAQQSGDKQSGNKQSDNIQ